jgi:Protein of unknown function (DUF551)
MEWQPIETYDALSKKPSMAVFFVQGNPPKERQKVGFGPLVVTSRTFGFRKVTHWMPIPKAPNED